MHKIGCKAFVLILAEHNPKFYVCSIECIWNEYARNLKAYRCYKKKTRKIYKTYHVKFHKSHEGLASTQTPAAQEYLTNKTTPYIHNDPEPTFFDDYLYPINPVQSQLPPQSNQQDLPKHNDALFPLVPQLQQSSRIPTPTKKTAPDNPPVFWVQRAVQELIEAGEWVCAWWLQVNSQELGIADPTGADLDQGLDPQDLANVTSIEDLEHLLALIKDPQYNPVAFNISD